VALQQLHDSDSVSKFIFDGGSSKTRYTIYGWMLHPRLTSQTEAEQKKKRQERREGKSDQ
jgi:hypothetical protein